MTPRAWKLGLLEGPEWNAFCSGKSGMFVALGGESLSMRWHGQWHFHPIRQFAARVVDGYALRISECCLWVVIGPKVCHKRGCPFCQRGWEGIRAKRWLFRLAHFRMLLGCHWIQGVPESRLPVPSVRLGGDSCQLVVSTRLVAPLRVVVDAAVLVAQAQPISLEATKEQNV